MTGRDLIIYILQNHLEDKELKELFQNGMFLDFYPIEDVAVKLSTGVETLKALYLMKRLKGFEIGDRIFIEVRE